MPAAADTFGLAGDAMDFISICPNTCEKCDSTLGNQPADIQCGC